ncbi:MAG: sigma-70 family RNA polymerase sigma factor [Alphaproteobacteria bacterium]|nr:MAG: sigma-70 family RNA polymerase sigma factor [Alphaproteobacteria bacterium]
MRHRTEDTAAGELFRPKGIIFPARVYSVACNEESVLTDRSREIEACIPDLRRYALVLCRDRDEADDLVQDTLERALSRWVLRRPGGALRPWLFAIQRNLFLNARRRDARSRRLFAPGGEFEGEAGAPPEAALELRQTLEMIDTLPETQKSALVLVAIEGFTYAETAAIMGVAEGTVMSRLSRARAHLRKLGDAPSGGSRLRRVK